MVDVRESLSRRGFLKDVWVLGFTIEGLDKFPSFQAESESRKFGLLDSIRLLNSLDLDPSTVSVKFQINDSWQPERLELSFISKNKDLIPEDQKHLNPHALGAKISLTVDIK